MEVRNFTFIEERLIKRIKIVKKKFNLEILFVPSFLLFASFEILDQLDVFEIFNFLSHNRKSSLKSIDWKVDLY